MYRVIVRVRQQFADRTGLSSAIAQIVVDGALFDAERMSDFGDGELLLSQAPRTGRCGLGRARLAPGVNAAFFSQANAGGLRSLVWCNSISAMPKSRLAIICPTGPLRSICCVTAITRTPRLHQSASTLTPSLRLRARRSSFQITTVVISPAKIAAWNF